MSIEQVSFVIPPRIKAGLAAGELVRNGGVVRNVGGQIVMHLPEVPTPKLDKAIGSALTFAKTNTTRLIPYAAASVLVGGTVFAFSAINRKKREQAEKRFQAALSAYFEAIDAGDMNLTVVAELDKSLKRLREITGKSTTAIIDGDNLESLIAYSRKFITHNYPTQLHEEITPQLVSLEDHLAEQKRIFDQAS